MVQKAASYLRVSPLIHGCFCLCCCCWHFHIIIPLRRSNPFRLHGEKLWLVTCPPQYTPTYVFPTKTDKKRKKEKANRSCLPSHSLLEGGRQDLLPWWRVVCPPTSSARHSAAPSLPASLPLVYCQAVWMNIHELEAADGTVPEFCSSFIVMLETPPHWVHRSNRNTFHHTKMSFSWRRWMCITNCSSYTEHRPWPKHVKSNLSSSHSHDVVIVN